jgi:hypothetical protein
MGEHLIPMRRVVKKTIFLETPSLRAISLAGMPALLKLLSSNLRAQMLGVWLSILPSHPHTGQVQGPRFNSNRRTTEYTSRAAMPNRFPILPKRLPARNISLIRKQRGQWPSFRRRLGSCQLPHNSQVDTLALIEIPSLIPYSFSSPSTAALSP